MACENWDISLSDTSVILLDTFRQLKGRVPIVLELSLYGNSYSMRALKVPIIDKSLCAYSYLDQNTAFEPMYKFLFFSYD
jgi:hypothetical protein